MISGRKESAKMEAVTVVTSFSITTQEGNKVEYTVSEPVETSTQAAGMIINKISKLVFEGALFSVRCFFNRRAPTFYFAQFYAFSPF